MLAEISRFAVYTICVGISISLWLFLSEAIAIGEEWDKYEGLFIISPLLIIVLLGTFIKNFKQAIFYPIIWGILLTLHSYIDSFLITLEPQTESVIAELQTEPSIFELAFTSPFPYLFAVFGLFYLFLITPLGTGFILSFIKRKVFTS